MSITAVVRRQVSTPSGTAGQFFAIKNETETFVCCTIERPWENNVQSISCIPEGTYTVKKRDGSNTSLKYPNAWEIMDVEGRTAILFHVANRPNELYGCIALNERFCYEPSGDGVWGVMSGKAFIRFDEFCGDAKEFKLLIID